MLVPGGGLESRADGGAFRPQMMDVGSGVDGGQSAQYPAGYGPMSSLQDFYSNSQHCSYSNPGE